MSNKVNLLTQLGRIVGLLATVALFLHVAIPAGGEGTAGGTTPPEKPAVTASSGSEKEAESAREGEPEAKLSLWTIIRLGGPLMYPLFALSLALVAMVTYFFLALSAGNIMPPAFLKRLQQMLRDRKTDEASMYCAQNKNMVSSIIRSGLEVAHKGPDKVLEAMNSEGSRKASSLWLRISFISDIAVVAPMIGLLGTVMGMLVAFMRVSGTALRGEALTAVKAGAVGVGQINPASLASGVAMAVITTVAGLMIAIPATMAYAYFRAVVQKAVINLETICSRYSDLIAEGRK